MNSDAQTGVTALLFTGPGCPYCPGIKQALSELKQAGRLAGLEVVDAASEPERAAANGVRSVPWLNLGGLILEGAHTPGELEQWLVRLEDGTAWPAWLDEQLSTGGLARVEALVREQPDRLLDVLPLAASPDTAMATRVGIGALLEGLEGSGLAGRLVDGLGALLPTANAQVRADACYYLSLTESEQALGLLGPCTSDSDATVREIAEEGVAHLREALGAGG